MAGSPSEIAMLASGGSYVEAILATSIPLALSLYLRLIIQVEQNDDDKLTITNHFVNDGRLNLASGVLIALSLVEFFLTFFAIDAIDLGTDLTAVVFAISHVLAVFLLVIAAIYALENSAKAWPFLVIYSVASLILSGALWYVALWLPWQSNSPYHAAENALSGVLLLVIYGLAFFAMQSFHRSAPNNSVTFVVCLAVVNLLFKLSIITLCWQSVL